MSKLYLETELPIHMRNAIIKWKNEQNVYYGDRLTLQDWYHILSYIGMLTDEIKEEAIPYILGAEEK